MKLRYDEKGLIPVIAQENETKEILMLAYANSEAVSLTEETGFAHYFSRSRQKIWKKGEESGHTQEIVRILVDCDEDALIYQVHQKGAACHTGYHSCFFRNHNGDVISMKAFDPEKVYSNRDE